MRETLKEQLDAIDASVFSGDAMQDSNTRAKFRWYMERWERELKLIEAYHTTPQTANDPDEEYPCW